MLKNLLYLYNDGHIPFPNMKGYGGLGYHLPEYRKVIHGGAITNERLKELLDEMNINDDGAGGGGRTNEEITQEIYRLMNENEELIEEKETKLNEKTEIANKELETITNIKDTIKDIKNDTTKREIKNLIKDIQKTPITDSNDTSGINEVQTTMDKVEDILQKKNNEIIDNDDNEPNNKTPIKEYIEKWKVSENKRQITSELKNLYNFTDEQKQIIDTFKKRKFNEKLIDDWIKTQSFEEAEIEEEPESFEPEASNILDKEIISEIKSEPLLSDDNINEKNEELLSVFNEYHSSENPFIEYMGNDEYESLNKTYDVGFVENLLYDNSGNYPAGKDFEDKVLANIDLVKSILISTYGSDRLDLTDLKINYEAAGDTGDLFTVFDAHAVTFKLDGKPKESFIEFKKYSNYASHTSDLSTLLDNERKEFDSFIYSISQKIQEINIDLDTLINDIETSKEKGIDYKTLEKEYKNKQKELRTYLKENDLSDKEKLLKSFYTNLNPVGVGVKYTKFPPLPHDLVRSETSVNKQEGYDYIMKYETNPKRRKKSNIETHMKAKNENIDILICTGLKNAMVVCNVSDLLSKFPDKTQLDFLQLKKTVYGTRQKGTKKPDYDHFNIPISYFKNVNLNIPKKSKTKK